MPVETHPQIACAIFGESDGRTEGPPALSLPEDFNPIRGAGPARYRIGSYHRYPHVAARVFIQLENIHAGKTVALVINPLRQSVREILHPLHLWVPANAAIGGD